ncbi:NmrA family NAD(P)-binding protein, partial [Streptomyces sp. DSM 41635]
MVISSIIPVRSTGRSCVMSTTVAVTGATCFIGKHVVRNLLSRGFKVRALT